LALCSFVVDPYLFTTNLGTKPPSALLLTVTVVPIIQKNLFFT
jgi:hypothetical protein